uniref:Sec1 family domain-containing protein 1 n=1 Tax=Soboliphyme baturini TaxID=241478 RepID=A0A183J0P1_9BILA
LRDARNNLFASEGIRSGHLSFQRPLLIILDRSLDLATPLHHTWTYQALIHDVLVLHVEKGSITKRRKDYDLNANDNFWATHKGSPFPAVAEAIQEELETYRNREEEIRRLKQAMGLDDTGSDEAISYLTDATAQLTSTVSSLPELLEKKRLIDVHTNLATAVLQLIKERKLDAFFEEEEKIMNRQIPNRLLIDLILDPECGSSEMEDVLSALETAGCDTSAVKFVRRWKRFTKTSAEQYGGGGTRTVSMFSKLLSQSSQFIMEGVKNLVIQKHVCLLRLDIFICEKPLPIVSRYLLTMYMIACCWCSRRLAFSSYLIS